MVSFKNLSFNSVSKTLTLVLLTSVSTLSATILPASAQSMPNFEHLKLESIESKPVINEKSLADAEAQYFRALDFLDRSNFQQAILELTNVIEINPNHALAYANRGMVYLELERYDAALSDLQKAADLLKNNRNSESYYYYQEVQKMIKFIKFTQGN